ncbi:MAG TPA: MFS transporter [Chloroflexia bacterium]|nr:MFS transporter [Chloroflexia bacterium]
MSVTRAPGPKFYSVLGYSNFRKLWIGQVISNVGDNFTMMAQLVLVNQITGSTLALAGMAIALTLPRLLFSLLAGVFVDRLDRRQLMIVADLLRMLLVLPMALVHRPDQVWIFYLCGFATSAVSTLFDPAKSALLPQLVPEQDLTRTNAFSQATMMLALLVGPLLAGVILEATAPSIAFVIDAVSFGISAAFIARIAVPVLARPRVPAAGPGAAVRTVLAEATEGVRALFGIREVRAVALVFAVAMLGLGAINVLAVAYLTRSFGVGPSGLGLLQTAQAIGMILGSIVVGQWLAGARPAAVISGGMAIVGFCLVGLAFAPSYLVVLALGLVIGLAIAPVEAVASTLQQTAVPDAQRGRVGAGMNTIIVSANLLSMSLAGVAGAVFGVAQVFVGGGLFVVAAAGVAAVLLNAVPASRPTPVPSESGAA